MSTQVIEPGITEQTLLEGSWLALEQAGVLLRDAVRLYEAGSYATAVALALLGREELGRSRILRDCSSEVAAGAKRDVSDVQARCDDHVRKQVASAFSIVLQPAGGTVLHQALTTYGQMRVDSDEWRTANKIIERATESKAARQAADRHDARCESLYVDLRDNGTDWHRPSDASPEEAYRHVNEAANDYHVERDRLTNVGLHAALAQHHPHVRAAEMHAANARSARPVELPTVGWPTPPVAR